ncbi:fasciclin-2 isoform X3 [Contarinia nasturtii]|uniref:fasciclin-2 isoform X3 n=1 Tax=Contarinia nasturtii TaxID=265458 RepID=UPI0012D37926|nr:fasciclin-2 isoform X3 [Contarinia nasturtii]
MKRTENTNTMAVKNKQQSEFRYRFTILNFIFISFVSSILIDNVNCQEPRLEILPRQTPQYRPIGKSTLMTCQAKVDNPDLITDLRWRGQDNINIMPKQSGSPTPPMYTEMLPGGQLLALIIPSLTETMAGKYYCSASYANTEILETSVDIETYVAITWRNAPEYQYPVAGKDYVVQCEVTANPAPTVDWLRNGDPIKIGDRYVIQTKGLLVRNVQESDDGIYTCRAVVVQTGEFVERDIRVEVQVLPKVQPFEMELEGIEDQPFSLKCNATGKPVPTYSWIKDSEQLNVESADRFQVNPLTGQLNILRVTKDDYGNYTCHAKNSAGEDKAKALINVLIRPRIYELWNITRPENEEAEIICKATGRPPPEITFRRWGSTDEFSPGQQQSPLDYISLEQRGDDYKGESTGVLRFDKLRRSDDGLYECIARNKGDSAYKNGHITVEYAPTFEHMSALPPVYTWNEQRANLSCLAQGFPNATIEWKWNDRPIKELNDPNLQIEGNGPRSDLLVIPRERRYYTAYKCVARNRLGQAEHLMELREARIPDVIPQAKSVVVTATTITFEILSPPYDPGLPITAFAAQYKDRNEPDWTNAYNRSWSPDSKFTVEGLRPQTFYDFRFAALNKVGLGQWGAYVAQATPVRSAPESPKILHNRVPNSDNKDEEPLVVSPYSDHFDLSWSTPPDNGEPINFYQIRYCPVLKVDGALNEINQLCETKNAPPSETVGFKMTELRGDTYYRIQIRAHNAIGFSKPVTLLMKTAVGRDLVIPASPVTSASLIAIAVGGVLLFLLIVDFVCCLTMHIGVIATLCRRNKRAPSELDEETKIGSLYGWRFPLPYCSGQLVKEPPPSPLPLPPPLKLGGSPVTTPDEHEPLNTMDCDSMKKPLSVEYDGRTVHSRSGGDFFGKNSAV